VATSTITDVYVMSYWFFAWFCQHCILYVSSTDFFGIRQRL